MTDFLIKDEKFGENLKNFDITLADNNLSEENSLNGEFFEKIKYLECLSVDLQNNK